MFFTLMGPAACNTFDNLRTLLQATTKRRCPLTARAAGTAVLVGGEQKKGQGGITKRLRREATIRKPVDGEGDDSLSQKMSLMLFIIAASRHTLCACGRTSEVDIS